jgi:hypothetical protein
MLEPDGFHPPLEMIEAYCQGAADGNIMLIIEGHIVDCADCSLRISQIVRASVMRSRAAGTGS